MKFCLSLILSLLCLFVWGQIPTRPEPARFVYDGAKWLQDGEAEQLEAKLEAYYRASQHQIVVATIPSLEGQNLERLANEWFNTWGIGQKDLDNGVLILAAEAERAVRIEVGRGLEETLSDVYCGRLIREVLGPYFKEKAYYQGLDKLSSRLMAQIGLEAQGPKLEVGQTSEKNLGKSKREEQLKQGREIIALELTRVESVLLVFLVVFVLICAYFPRKSYFIFTRGLGLMLVMSGLSLAYVFYAKNNCIQALSFHFEGVLSDAYFLAEVWPDLLATPRLRDIFYQYFKGGPLAQFIGLLVVMAYKFILEDEAQNPSPFGGGSGSSKTYGTRESSSWHGGSSSSGQRRFGGGGSDGGGASGYW